MLETLRNARVHFKDITCFGVETTRQIAANETINGEGRVTRLIPRADPAKGKPQAASRSRPSALHRPDSFGASTLLQSEKIMHGRTITQT